MARFLDSTSSIKKEAGKKKKKQETTQPKQTTQSPSYSQKVQQTNQRLTQKYGGGGSGGSTRTTTSRTNPDQRTTQAQNQKMYGQPTQPVRRNQAELQRQKEERRSRAQEQKSGNFERPISRAQYADKRRATSFREKYTRWDNDIAETVGHTLKQTVAEDKRYLNRAAKGITMKDRHQWATPEQIRKADERTERRDRKYASQIEKEGQELEKLKQGHSYLGQQALSATSSATGMAADLAVGALTGTGEAGSLGHMFMRSTGGAYGQVKKKAASLRKQLEASGNYTPDELDEMFKDVDKRDELNAMASGGIEVLSELMFRGFGPAAKYVGKGGGIAERAAGKLFKKAGGKATSGIVKNALRGTAEEVAEEEIGGPLQALAANTIYGNKYQKYSEDAVKRDFKAQSDELRSQIHSDEDAQMVTARLNSDAFMNDSIKAYMDSGMSEDEARQMAEMSREYLTASLSGDIDKMSEMQNKLVDKLAGGENSLKEKFTLRDAVDAAVSTSMMTLTTGVPGAISTAQAGRAYKGTQGLEGVRNLAEVVRNWDTEESAKAQKIIDAIDNGSDVSDTQVYELIQKAGSAAEAQSEAETTKDQIAQKGMEKYDLRVVPAVRDEYGDVTLSENTQQRYDKIVNDTVSRYDSLAKLGESEKFEKAHVKQGASLAAAQMTGVITAEDVHELVKADPEVKAVFQDVTGIALDQFTEYDKNGNIDVAATNNSMMNALMAEAATNYINSARLEQAAWANDVRGEMLQTMSDNLNSKGDEALFDALQTVDPRDRDTFMLTGMASQYVYEHGWSTQDTWEEAKGDLQRMFPSLSVDSLQGVYEAAKEDRIESETPFLNAQVVKDEALTELAKSGQKAEVRGKFKNRTKRVLNAEETVICASLAKQFNANITMVGEKNKNLSYIDENGEEKFSNAVVVISKGEIYISKKADISKIIHEVTHMGAKLASTQYLDMAHYIMDKAYKHSPERTRMLVEAYKRTYQGQNLTDAQIEEEVVADIVTAFEHDRVFLREIAQEEPSLFRRIYNAICDVIRTLRNILSTGRVLDPELQETFLAEIGAYEDTRRMWLDMMHEAARNNAVVGLAKWENNAYKDSRESRDISNTDSEGNKLSKEQQDADYMDAVDRGDMETAQRMVDEAAKAAGYTLRGYHGTNLPTLNENYEPVDQTDYANKILPYTIFRPGLSGGIYVATNKEYAEAISKGFTREKGTVMGLYVKFENPLVVNEHVYDSVPRYFNIPTPSIMKQDGYNQETLSTEEISEYAQNNGYDGVIIEGIREGGDIYTDDYIAFSSDHLKLADPVTYDDNGDVIPLNERFNQESSDIRYSITPEQQETIEHNVGPDVRFSVPTWRETLAKAIFNSSEGYSAYDGKKSGRQITYDLTKNNFSEEQAKAVTDYMDMMATWFEKTGTGSLRAKYKFIGWDDLTKAEVQVKKDSNNNIVGVTVSAMVKNGEYPVNFDLTTVCNKREGFSEVIKNLINTKVPGTENNVLNTIKLTDENMWKINKALKAEGIDTACLGCFVEARRYYAQNFMNKIDDKWNSAVRKARKELGLPEEEYFNFAKGKEVSGEEWSAIDDLWSAYDESTESKSSPADRIKILMDEIVKNKEVDSPYLKLIQMSDISTPEGYNAFKQLSTKGHDMVKTIKSIYGTSAPKEILAFTPYNSEIALLPINMKGMDTGDYLRSIGGIRVQSFSDFKIEHVFEHFQMVADEAARKFVTHGYSKVIAFPRIFGLTGRKINMSVMFDVLPNRAWSQALGIPVRKAAKYAKKYQGLQFVKEKPAENPDNRPYIETEIEGVHGYLTYLVSDADYVSSIYEKEYAKNIEAGMTEDKARRAANESKPFEQSINYREAVELENQDGYKENVGIIAVAYGDEHLKVLLSDPNVRYIIPYHKSGLPTFISKKTSLAIARDYTNFQNTNKAEFWKDAKGKEVDFKKEYAKYKKAHKDEKYPAIGFFKEINDNKYKVKFESKTAAEKAAMAGTADFDVYEDLGNVSDIREVSNKYLEHCIERNWVPVFHEFAGDPNYYKMLFDFAVTDGTTTNIYPQRAVRNNYPGLDIDAKVAAGEEITDADLAELKKAVEKGAKEQNAKNMTRANNMGNVMNDLLSRDTENSIISDTNLQSIRWDTPDYTDVKLGNEEMTPKETDADARLSISVNLDDDYMDAYFDGDDDAMQDLVDMAAERAGYKYKAYHHTENAFTVFDRSKARRTMDIQGFYFSADPEAEREYGSVRYDVFLKINNPYVVDSSEKMKALPFDYGTEDAGVRTREWLQENGYDAVIRDAEYYGAEADEIIVFESEQIKSSEPMLFEDDPNGEYGEGDVIPLSQRFDPLNPDIRYSLPTQDSDGNILTDGQMEYFKNSQARDEQGRLVRVFHTTNKGGFTIFDPMKSDDHRSLFFTNDRNMSASYSKQEGVNPAVINPYDEALPKRTIDDVTALPDFGDLDVSDKDVVSSISNIQVMNRAGEVIASGDDFYKVAQEVGRYLESDGYDLLDDFAVDPALIEDGPWGESLGDAWELYNSIRNAGLKYTMDYGNPAVTYSCYLNLENPMIIDGRGQYWDEINVDGEMHDTRGWSEIAYNQGYDGVVIRDIVDYGDSGYGLGANDVFIAFSSNQVKDTRNENPSENPDIRYSKIDEDEALSIAAHDYAYDTSHEMLLHYENMMQDLQDKDTANAYRKAKKYVESNVDKFYSGLTWYADGMKFDDPVLEEGRERMASSKADFFSSNEARWNERWLTEGRVLDARSVRSPIRKLVMSVMENADTEYKYKTDLVNKTIVDVRMAYDYAKQGRTDIADALLWHSALRMVDGVDFIDDSVYKDYKDLRDYLRTTKISLSEEYWADVDYQAFRKNNYNKINLVSGETNVDQIYQEMCELWPEWFREDEEMTPPDQLARMEQVLNAIQPYTIAYSSEEAADMAFDIASDLTRIIREEGKEYKSIADKYKEKYEQRTKALKERHQEALREVKRNSKDLEKKAKAKFKEYKAEQKEKKYHDKYFDSIKGSYDELVKRLRTNTKDKHIPEQYKRELAALLSAFDFQTVRSKKMEVKKGKDGYERLDLSQKTIQLRQLQGILKGIEENTQFFRVNDSITDLMDSLLGIELGKYSESMNVEGKTIDELNSEQLKRLDKMLKSLIHEFNNYENVRVGEKKEKAAKIGAAQIESSLAHAAKYGVGKDYHNLMGALDRIINMDELTPAYLFRQVDAEGDGIGIMFGELRKSFDRYVRNQAQLNEWIGEIVGKYHEKGILWNKYGSGELTKWRSVNYQKEFMLENGKSVKLTPAQMMSIHCLAKRTQAYNHMTGAGIVVKPVAFEAKLISDLKQKGEWALPRKLTDNDIRMIENELTPEQIDVADKLQELMATKMAEWGNEASMNVLGIRLFEDKDYFPIKSDKSALEKDFDPQQFNEMIKNFGFTKAVAPGAKNAIAIDDIFDVVSEHCNNMNLYNAYTEALNDFTKVYNYHQLGPDDSDYSVEQAIAHAYSQKATTFIRTFIQDLNGNVSRGRASGLTDVMNDMLGKAKKASVFANGRVALQQPTALFRAFAVINPKYLKGAKAPTKANLQEMFDHCPIALWKSWGYYDINMGKSVEDLMMNNGSWAEDTMSDIYGKLDNATWCVLWNMCKAEVKEKNPDVKEGTEEYWDLCNKRMTEVVDLTQVVDSPFHRSHAMRSKDILHKMSTAFMAEPTLTFNMVRDGIKRAHEAYADKDYAKASKILGRTASVFVVQAAAVAGAAAIWDAVRGKKPDKDDEDDKFFHLWWANAVENFKDNLKLWNNIYYVKDVSSLFDGWNISNLGLQGFVHLRDAWFQLTGKKKVQSSLTWYENAFAGAGYLTGMPFKTIMNDSKAIMGIFGLDLTALSLLDDEFTRFQSAVQDLMGGEASANGFTKTYDSGSKITDEKKEAKAESNEPALPTSVRGWTYDEAPFHVEDGSLADKVLNHFGVNLTAAEINAIEEAEAEKALKAKIEDIKSKTESLSDEEKDKKIWSYVQSYMKAENGDKSWSELVAEGDYASVGSIEAMYIRAGGNVEYFDGRIMAESKSALKKSISSDNTPEQIQAQAQIRDYLLNNGMEPSEVSEIAYKSYTAKDLKIAFRINDKEAMLTELRALVQAGLTEEDYQKLWDNRNRIDIKKYKESGGKYADRLKSTGVYNWPINGSITSRFGHRSSPGGVGSTNHQGLDIAGSMGDPVGASDGGTVVYAGWYGGAGKTVMIEHDDGTVTQYSHLSWWDCNVGDIVAQGQYIGKVGSTGNSTGPHLHFGVKKDGVYQDPETYLANR